MSDDLEKAFYERLHAMHERNKRSVQKRKAGEPELAIFWFFPAEFTPDFWAMSRPFTECPVADGRRTYDGDHYREWERLIKHLPHLRFHDYAHWPRGRVNWLASEGKFLVLADPKLNKPVYRQRIHREFRLSTRSTRWDFADEHYTSEGYI